MLSVTKLAVEQFEDLSQIRTLQRVAVPFTKKDVRDRLRCYPVLIGKEFCIIAAVTPGDYTFAVNQIKKTKSLDTMELVQPGFKILRGEAVDGKHNEDYHFYYSYRGGVAVLRMPYTVLRTDNNKLMDFAGTLGMPADDATWVYRMMSARYKADFASGLLQSVEKRQIGFRYMLFEVNGAVKMYRFPSGLSVLPHEVATRVGAGDPAFTEIALQPYNWEDPIDYVFFHPTTKECFIFKDMPNTLEGKSKNIKPPLTMN